MLDSLLVFKNKGEDGAIPLNADNVNYNFNLIKQLLNVFHPIGEYFETSDVNFDPNVSWGGTWVLDNDGTVLVSKSTVTNSAFNKAIGTITGEEKHQLVADELPKFGLTTPHISYCDSLYTATNGTHQYNSGFGAAGTNDEGVRANLNNGCVHIYSFGKDESHNNIQPSKIIYRWHRTA